MNVIRGATTISTDKSEHIIDSVIELLNEILLKNNLKRNKIIAIFFSSTKDITAEYPAKAARIMGFNDIALMCFQEMDVKDSLKHCIRLSIFYDDVLLNKINHIYLRDAVCLRPDLIIKEA